MRKLLSALLLPALVACSPSNGDEPRPIPRIIELAGQLEDDRLTEASGLAASIRRDDALWVLNDGGAKAIVHAIDLKGGIVGQLRLDEVRNRDWEDLATFSLDGEPYLLVGDIGDNDGRYDTLVLHAIAEPDLGPDNKLREDVDWQIEFVYPDGARDAEALAVDTDEMKAYILSKRDLPPRLYTVPLKPETDATITAELLGDVRSLPPPRRRDQEMAGITKDWFWQPTAMDFSRDGRFAIVLTYRAIYLFQRESGQSWYDALNTEPLGLTIDRIREAESAAIGADGRTVFLTVEGKKPPLFRIDISTALDAQDER